MNTKRESIITETKRETDCNICLLFRCICIFQKDISEGKRNQKTILKFFSMLPIQYIVVIAMQTGERKTRMVGGESWRMLRRKLSHHTEF